MKRDCSHNVPPGGGATPPTITSPTSPSAWQETTWMILEARMDAVLCLREVGLAKQSAMRARDRAKNCDNRRREQDDVGARQMP